MTTEKNTPMMTQYLSIKAAYPDTILFYRMGDFYEMFNADAEIAAKLLEITLTSRNKNDPAPIPMCGIPVRAKDTYIARLIEKGQKVAICEQVEDAAAAKGLVKREVVRVITPGMVLDTAILDAGSDNFVLAAHCRKDTWGFAWIDISTGTFRVAETGMGDASQFRRIIDDVLRIAPREIILPDAAAADPRFTPFFAPQVRAAISHAPDGAFNARDAEAVLIDQFNTRSLRGFGCEAMPAAIGAAGALIRYVQEMQKQALPHLRGIETIRFSDYLQIDDTSCRNLELLSNIQTGTRTGTLIGVMDQTVTPMGARLLKSWIRYPVLCAETITARLDAVEEAAGRLHDRGALRACLKGVYDLERLSSRISMGQGNARDLLALKDSLNRVPELFKGLSGFKAALFSNGPATESLLAALADVAGLIDRSIREDAPLTLTEGNLIKPGFHEALDELIDISRNGKSRLAALEAEEKSKTGINSMKIKFNKVFGYFLEVPKSQVAAVPDHYIRKQTLTNAERYITEELKTFETKILTAQERRSSLEYELFNTVRKSVLDHQQAIADTAGFIARVDGLLALAETADMNAYVRPDITNDGVIHIEEGRHPVVEKLLTGERYVPNTIHLDNSDQQVLVITGPNMAGKSTVLRQVALTVVMAQAGSFVPAQKASVSLTDKVFTRVGALDNLSQGQSTFMVEMEETANIINNATPDSLVVIDEIGRGTSTFDGLSIAWAVADFLHGIGGKGVKTLFATHYHELTELAATRERVQNFHIAVKEWNEDIIFLHKLVEGGTNRSYGIQVARLAGLPKTIIKTARTVLARVENGEHLIDAKEKAAAIPPGAPRQLDLFAKPDPDPILERIRGIDVEKTTPIEAISLLHQVRQEVIDFLNKV